MLFKIWPVKVDNLLNCYFLFLFATDTISLSGSRANQMLMNTNMGNPMGQQVNMVPQNANNQMNTATNLLQNLNQRPNQNQMQNIQNKMPGMTHILLI